MKAFTGRDELITHLPIRGRGFGEIKILYLLNSQCCSMKAMKLMHWKE